MPAPLRTQHGYRMAALMILFIFLVAPATAIIDDPATAIIDDELLEIIDTSKSGYVPTQEASSGGLPGALNSIVIKDITKFQHVSYFDFVVNGNQGYEGDNYLSSGVHDTTYTFNGQTKPCRIYISRSTNLAGIITSTKFTIFFEGWDIGDLSGTQWVNTPYSFYKGSVTEKRTTTYWEDNPTDIALTAPGSYKGTWDQTYQAGHATGLIWKNHIRVNEVSGDIDGYEILLNRTLDGIPYHSVFNVYNDGLLVFTNSEFGTDINIWYPLDSIDKINITSPAEVVYNYPLKIDPDEPGDSDAAAVTVYVRSSQTGALISGSHIIINASVGGEFYEVINQTLPSGTYQASLQPTGGGLSNPDSYRLVVSADGYVPVMPHLDFEHGPGPTTLIMEMDPTGGGPTDPDKTYVDIYVRDIYANPIPGAAVNFGGYILTTNSAGYGVLEVLKNATYKYTVSKSGYITIEGPVTLGDGPRHTINVVLGPGEVPTYTPTPTAPGATPTPDRRTNEQKGQAVIDMIADFAEPIALLAIVATVFGLMQMMMPRRR